MGTYVLAVGGLVAVAGLVVVLVGPWRVGTGMIGGAMLLGSVARSLLDDRRSGMLRVRRPISDVTAMSLLGVVIIALAILVPEQPPGL